MLISVFVYGQPVQFPKKDIRIIKSKSGKMFPQLYEKTPKKEVLKENPAVHPDYWRRAIRRAIVEQLSEKEHLYTEDDMRRAGVFPVYKRSQPIKILTIIYRPKPKTTKYQFPVTKPDLDNYTYLPHNLLQDLVYEDDSQICWQNEIKTYATNGEPTGMRLIVGAFTGDIAEKYNKLVEKYKG